MSHIQDLLKQHGEPKKEAYLDWINGSVVIRKYWKQ